MKQTFRSFFLSMFFSSKPLEPQGEMQDGPVMAVLVMEGVLRDAQ